MPSNNGSPVGVLFVQTADAVVANTGVETTLVAAGVGSLTLPLNFFRIGKTIRIRMRGRMSDTGTPTFRLRIKLGATVVLDTGAVALAGTISNNEWCADAMITCRTTGVGGTVSAQGAFQEDPDNRVGMPNTAPIVVDTTVAQAIGVTWLWGAADPANTVTCTNLTVEAMG